MTCDSCKYWDPSFEVAERGLCRCRSPRLNTDGSGIWPDTRHDDWCGEGEAKPPRNPEKEAREKLLEKQRADDAEVARQLQDEYGFVDIKIFTERRELRGPRDAARRLKAIGCLYGGRNTVKLPNVGGPDGAEPT